MWKGPWVKFYSTVSFPGKKSKVKRGCDRPEAHRHFALIQSIFTNQ